MITYFIQHKNTPNGPIKVGRTEHLQRRLKIKRDFPAGIQVLGVIEGDHEQLVKDLFHYSRVGDGGSEWYQPSPELLSYILSHATIEPDERERLVALRDAVVANPEAMTHVRLAPTLRPIADCQAVVAKHFGERVGKQFEGVTQCIDMNTAAGRLLLNLMLSIAQWEREATSERTKAALATKIAAGDRVGKLRYGYDLTPDGQHLVENDVEQENITLMHQLRKTMSLRAIAAELDRRGIKTKEGKQHWHHYTIGSILRADARS